MEKVITAILGGGQGSWSRPLTRDRAKPAAPIGGKYRLIDIPISNSLTPASTGSSSLPSSTARASTATSPRPTASAPSRSATSTSWPRSDHGAQGLVPGHGRRRPPVRPAAAGAQSAEGLILSGDQLYLMNIGSSSKTHRERGADLTIAVKPVTREEAPGFGILRLDPTGRVLGSTRSRSGRGARPAGRGRTDPGRHGLPRAGGIAPGEHGHLHLQDPRVVRELLVGSSTLDFGREVIPQSLDGYRVYAYPYEGDWTDIGTIPSFHQANLDLTCRCLRSTSTIPRSGSSPTRASCPGPR